MRLSYEVFHRDIRALVDFYVDVLGFEKPTAEPSSGHVIVRRDGIRVACCAHDGADPIARKPPAGSEIVLWVDDVRSEYDRVLGTGWPIEGALQQRPWGFTDFRVFDPSGQYLRISDGGADR